LLGEINIDKDIAEIPRPNKRGRPANYRPVGYAANLPNPNREEISSGLMNYVATRVMKTTPETKTVFTGKVVGVSKGNSLNNYTDRVTVQFPQQYDDIEEYLEYWTIDEMR
jgi:hypothetical protein